MKRIRHTPEQIIRKLHEVDAILALVGSRKSLDSLRYGIVNGK